MTAEISRISVYVEDGANVRTTVEMAGRVADSFGASLVGLHVMADAAIAAVTPVHAGTMTPMLIEELRQQAKVRAASAERHFQSVLAKHDWDGHWRCIDERHGLSSRDRVARALHLADFVVVGQKDPDDETHADQVLIQDLVVDTGRPIIVHPHRWSRPIGDKSALVAWKPGREAARAVHDALPFLVRAEKVTVTTVSSEEKPAAEDEGGALCRYLGERGIDTKSRPLYGIDDRDVGDALLNQASSITADLIVLGGFSHSRLREGIFGGVTQDIIERTRFPALMSH